MYRITRDTPALYLTSVARDRLPVFRTDQIKTVTCSALDEARHSGGFLIFEYVIMPDHMHLITCGTRRIADTLRFVNGISGHRIISHLKEQGHQSSLDKLKRQSGAKGHTYSLWDHHPNALQLMGEDFFMQKVNYIHQNPVRAGLIERAEDYRWSSARWWSRRPLGDEPLRVDIDQIQWRSRK